MFCVVVIGFGGIIYNERTNEVITTITTTTTIIGIKPTALWMENILFSIVGVFLVLSFYVMFILKRFK